MVRKKGSEGRKKGPRKPAEVRGSDTPSKKEIVAPVAREEPEKGSLINIDAANRLAASKPPPPIKDKHGNYPIGSRLTDEQRLLREEGFCAVIARIIGTKEYAPVCRNRVDECLIHCGALSKTSGIFCTHTPVRGRTRCRYHGGTSKAGLEHGMAGDLGYSKYLPKDLIARFEAALADPSLISMKQDLALLHLRIEELIQRLSTGEHGTIWSDLKYWYDRFLVAMRKGEQEDAGIAIHQLGQVIEKGVSVEAAWSELFDSIERKTVVAGREWKRMADLQHLMSAEEAMALVTSIMASVRTHVSSAQEKALIAADLAGLLGVGFRQPRRTYGPDE